MKPRRVPWACRARWDAVNDLWTFDEFDRAEAHRAARLRTSPTWPELIQQIRLALRAALEAEDARFGFDESIQDSRDLRANVQFQLGPRLFDWVFNGLEGYRAQFRIGRDNGLAQNARLVSELCAELSCSARRDITVRLLTHDFKDKGPIVRTIGDVLTSMEPELSKIWICEKLIGKSGEVQELFVSRTGPKLVFLETEAWWSFFPEDAPGWLDLKGAFVTSTGRRYPLKSPYIRAANLEERGSA